MSCEIEQSSLESFLTNLSQRPSRFQVHAEGVLKRLQRNSNASQALSRVGTASSAMSSELEAGKESPPGAAAPCEEQEQQQTQRWWFRGITCDVPSRPAEQEVVSARQLSVSLSSPAPPMSREALITKYDEYAVAGIPQPHPSSDEHPSAGLLQLHRTRSHSDASTVWDPGLSDSSGTSGSSSQEQVREPTGSPPLQAAVEGGRGELMVRERRGLRSGDGSKAMSLRDLPEVGWGDDVLPWVADAALERRLPWPQDVLQLLERPVRSRSKQRPGAELNTTEGREPNSGDVQKVDSLRFSSGGFGLPHPEKASSTGADSYFLGSDCFSLGIADGVGEWEWRFGINARAFADELMAGCQAALKNTSGQSPLDALEQGFRGTKSFGSSTALVASLNGRSGHLGVANIGDSALLLLRHQEVHSTVGLRCAGRTREQQHAFNCPFQLSLLPTPADFPELVRQGKEKLVRAIQRRPNAKVDQPQDADLYSFEVQEGDLVVLGTDGVFDNIYLHEICQLAGSTRGPLEPGGPSDPAKLAQAICKAAFHRSTDRSARSPFGDHAKQAGLYHMGGKMDDITCVCAWVVQDK
eukprot:TRINITY_DN2862_c0_g2_i1.p1 TRINITY_DN2862_c0_g2~~TRINITY_DN2862_c0_g2_i1.p1  ORF type:complete len:582 (+),score=75.98 TRINITY_DN2862_c0_g2_i1:128-1873(+)